MSHHGKKKANRRKQRRRVLTMECFSCGDQQRVTPQLLLERLAESLNLLEQAGMTPRVRSEFIIAEGQRGGGFILPPLNGSSWEVHMVTYNASAHHLARREDDTDS